MPREVDIVCITLMIYDYLCTLTSEAQYIWTSRWSMGLGLFYLNRYLVFIDQGLLYDFANMANPSDVICERVFKAGVWIFVIGENISTIILFLQTYAVWGGKPSVVYPLGLLQFAKVVTSTVLTHLEWNPATYPVISTPKGLKCFIVSAAAFKLARWRYVIFSLVEAVTVFATLFRARYHITRSNSSWIAQLYKNGILFSVVIVAMSIANVLMPLIKWKSPGMIGLLTNPQRILDSLLCNRVMFVMFKQRHALKRHNRELRQSTVLGGRSRSSGNIFTSVHTGSDISTTRYRLPEAIEMVAFGSGNTREDPKYGWIS
ncbi:hypothetical protein BKA70DRAFT_1466023 [Coprinopsis sp. MPI-PUGE-AT-0042]|nr:hypothetical protein BKA70DRAFT_1466023 [Coprinopsis sp. MPI-PUGE-AT-0042]